METVAFYSYKGGVGRSLLVANTAQFLAMSERKVVVLDLDFEAPGLHEKLADPDLLDQASNGTLKGAVDYLLATVQGTNRIQSLREIAIPIRLPDIANEPNDAHGELNLIAAGAAPSMAYWATLEALHTALKSRQPHDGLAEAVLELQAQIAQEFAPDFLLIDARTGITELGGLATSLLADRVICMTTNSRESVNGIKVVAEALRKAPRLPSQAPLKLEFVLTRLDGETLGQHDNLIEQLGGDVALLPHDPSFTESDRVYGAREFAGATRTADEWDEKLFSATLDWIGATFPAPAGSAEAAARRLAGTRRKEMIARYGWPLPLRLFN